MNKKQELVLGLINKITDEYNTILVGDDFMGYKFKGEDDEFWNDLLMDYYDNDETEFLNSNWLKDNGVKFGEWNSQ